MHFHDLRQTSATLAIAKGEPLKVTQERLGHASPATTLAMYGHATPEMHGEAADGGRPARRAAGHPGFHAQGGAAAPAERKSIMGSLWGRRLNGPRISLPPLPQSLAALRFLVRPGGFEPPTY